MDRESKKKTESNDLVYPRYRILSSGFFAEYFCSSVSFKDRCGDEKTLEFDKQDLNLNSDPDVRYSAQTTAGGH